jgi:hypothetical protein
VRRRETVEREAGSTSSPGVPVPNFKYLSIPDRSIYLVLNLDLDGERITYLPETGGSDTFLPVGRGRKQEEKPKRKKGKEETERERERGKRKAKRGKRKEESEKRKAKRGK